jgi:Dolichyl-phosphate-mannose-protein mannosyltransferase
MSGRNQKGIIPVLPVLACLAIALGQYYFRSFDDNRLASWYFLFTSASLTTFILVLVPGLLLAVYASRFSLPAPGRVFFLFSACFISSAAMWNIPEIWLDACRYFTQAKHLEIYGIKYFFREWGRGIPAYSDLPAVPFLYGLIFRTFGEARLFVQIFNSLLFSFTGVLTFLIGKELWDEEKGFTAGLLLLGMPYLFIMTPLMLVDIPLMFFLTLSIYLFISAVTGKGAWRTVVAAAAVFTTAYTKYTAAAWLSVLPVASFVYFLESDGPGRRRIIRRSLAVFLLSSLLIGAAAAFKWDVIVGQIGLLKVMQKAIRVYRSESYISTFLFQIHPLVTLAALVSCWAALRKRDLRFVIAVWAPLLIILLRLNRVRYELPAFPMLALMASYGIGVLRDRALRKAVVASTVAASLVAVFFVYHPYVGQLRINLKRAGESLNSLAIDCVEVFISPQKSYPLDPAVAVPILDIYTRKKILYKYAFIPGKVPRDVLSWDYPKPEYYDLPGAGCGNGKKAVALIVGRPQDKPSPAAAEAIDGLRHSAFFSARSRGYSFHTLLRIYW